MTAVGRLGEDALIARLRARLGGEGGPRLEGIGDDAALLRPSPGALLALTSDLLLEDVHFRRSWSPPRLLGRKALAVNLSDLAAMGAVPVAWLLDLGLPGDWGLAAFDDMVSGFADQAEAVGGLALAGGDTCMADRLHIGVTAVGETAAGAVIRRRGARPGDLLAVTGAVGAASAGLALLERGWRLVQGAARPPAGGGGGIEPSDAAFVLRAHLSPEPELAAGRRLAGKVSAGLDLSDGLARDLPRICAASECGARIDLEAVPVAPAAAAVLAALGEDPARAAVSGGEDYRLLVALAPGVAAGLAGLHVIGEVLPAAAGLALRARGRDESWPRPGFEHFQGS